MTATTAPPDIADHIARLIAEAPPLSDTIRDRITALIRAGR